MTTKIVVPALGESVTEVTVSKWMKKVGDPIALDEAIAELETDKATQELFAPVSGRLGEIKAEAGSVVGVGAVIGTIEEGAVENKPAPTSSPAPSSKPANGEMRKEKEETLSPSVRKIAEEKNLNVASIAGTGKGGRVTKADVVQHLAEPPASQKVVPMPQPTTPMPIAKPAPSLQPPRALLPSEERVPMSRLRRRIAERLKQAQEIAAILTTFNEVDMSGVMGLRDRYRETFEKKYGFRLGFMGFFVKAAIQALKEIPAVNAEIEGTDIIYKNHYDIGVAVGTEQGLVVPVVRDADHLSLPQIEAKIAELGKRARDGKLSIEELQGGTFTISNGGVYGSLMSTPILNPPQSAILGMHKIQQRPVVIDGKIEIRPMMYLALSYDHRIIDGREAVTFLVRIKECLEDPQRLILEL